MKRRAIVVVGLMILCAGALAAAQSIPKVGTQTVLLSLPADFHDEELVHVLQHFVEQEADIYVTSADTMSGADVAALTARIPSHYFTLMPGNSGGPRVTVIPSIVSFEFLYGKVLFIGGGWYDEYFAASGYTGATEPSYADGLYWMTDRILAQHGTIGAVGAGIYPVIFSGVLPAGSTVPAYPCSALIGAIAGQGYQPMPAEQTAPPNGSGLPLIEAVTYQTAVNSADVLMTPIPNSWYPTDDGLGEQLITDYGTAYTDFIRKVEAAFRGIGDESAIRITNVECGPDGMVTLRNDGDNPVNLAGWTLRSVDLATGETSHTYTFGEYELAPGASVQVYYGTMMWSGPEDFLHWTEDIAIPPGGRAVLVDPQGNERSTMGCE